MAFKAISRTHREWVTLDCDPNAKDADTESRTEFLIGPLTARQLAAAKDRATHISRAGVDNSVEMEFRGNVSALETVTLGLHGWRRFTDADGNAVEFNVENIELLGLEAVRELASKIEALSRADLSDRKSAS